MYLTSDNKAALLQMKQFSRHPQSVLTPIGCHTELDPSEACFIHTVTYWFSLSLSQSLIVQVHPDGNGGRSPHSAFSRYAAVSESVAGIELVFRAFFCPLTPTLTLTLTLTLTPTLHPTP